MTTGESPKRAVDRRTVIRGAAMGGLTLPLLSACSASDAVSVHETHRLLAAKDVPIGGGLVLPSQLLVVTQPVRGEFKGFSAICTHRQCLLGGVSDGAITCPCHGSAFSITTGVNVVGPLGGPPGSVPPLAAVKVKVSGTEVVRGGPVQSPAPPFVT
jgi:nitrite reductase/ring-hydroxylating ferredoxin subunit